jgi:anti-sigma factor RsiW
MEGCAKVRDQLLDLVDGELSAEESREAEAHLGRCPVCSREARELREILAGVRALPQAAVPDGLLDGFAEAVQRRIADEAPRRPPFQGSLAAWLRDLPGLQPIPALSAAVILGLLLAIGLVRTARTPQPSPVPEVLAVGESFPIAQNLDVLEQFDLLEDLDLLEQLPMLRAPETDRPLKMS